jgi:hypothetical protein
MTTLRLTSRPNVDIEAPGGLPLHVEVAVGGDVDYSGYLAFFNIATREEPEVALIEGTTAGGECHGIEGGIALTLSASKMQQLPRRPLLYEAWLESPGGTEVVLACGGTLAVRPTVGSEGTPPPDLDDDIVLDGGSA